MVLLRHRAGVQHSRSPAKTEGGAVMSKYNPVMSGKRLKSDFDTGKCPCSRQKKASAKNTRAVGLPDQYRATMMIATNSIAAISESKTFVVV
jgi:hypothetical protein